MLLYISNTGVKNRSTWIDKKIIIKKQIICILILIKYKENGFNCRNNNHVYLVAIKTLEQKINKWGALDIFFYSMFYACVHL